MLGVNPLLPNPHTLTHKPQAPRVEGLPTPQASATSCKLTTPTVQSRKKCFSFERKQDLGKT